MEPELITLGKAIRRHALAGCLTMPQLLDLIATDDTVPQSVRDYFESTVRPCLLTRGKRKGGLRASPAPGSTGASHCFLRAYQWHGGATGGNLGGPIMDRLRYPDDWDRADSLAQILRIAIGRPMTAMSAWQQAIHGA